ncbi:hypothetical protein Tco_0352993 [Tanacetum coccineum]
MLLTKCFMLDKVFSRVVDFMLTSMAHMDQFSLAHSGHPGSGTTFYVGYPVELSLMTIRRWVSILLLTILTEPEVQRMMSTSDPEPSRSHAHTPSSKIYSRHQSRLKESYEH